MHRLLKSGLTLSVALATFAPLYASGYFDEDPLSNNPQLTRCITNTFMQWDSTDNTNLHRGIDVSTEVDENVKGAVSASESALVYDIQVNSQSGKEVYLLDEDVTVGARIAAYFHVTPLSSLSINSIVGPGDHIGKTASAHLHIELWRSSSAVSISRQDAVNPLQYAFDNAKWRGDATAPRYRIYGKDDSDPTVGYVIFEAWDPPKPGTICETNDLVGGVYSIKLLVNGKAKDEIVFDRFRLRQGSQPPIDSGNYYWEDMPGFLYLIWSYRSGEPKGTETITAEVRDYQGNVGIVASGGTIAGISDANALYNDRHVHITWTWSPSDLIELVDFRILRRRAGNSNSNADLLTTIPQEAGLYNYEFTDRLLTERGDVEYVIEAWSRLGLIATRQVRTAIPGPSEAILTVFPNPTNRSTAWHFSAPTTDSLTVAVYDIVGRPVRTLSFERNGDGIRGHWDGSDEAANVVPNGLYFIRLVYGGRSIQRKVMVVR